MKKINTNANTPLNTLIANSFSTSNSNITNVLNKVNSVETSTKGGVIIRNTRTFSGTNTKAYNMFSITFSKPIYGLWIEVTNTTNIYYYATEYGLPVILNVYPDSQVSLSYSIRLMYKNNVGNTIPPNYVNRIIMDNPNSLLNRAGFDYGMYQSLNSFDGYNLRDDYPGKGGNRIYYYSPSSDAKTVMGGLFIPIENYFKGSISMVANVNSYYSITYNLAVTTMEI